MRVTTNQCECWRNSRWDQDFCFRTRYRSEMTGTPSAGNKNRSMLVRYGKENAVVDNYLCTTFGVVTGGTNCVGGNKSSCCGDEASVGGVAEVTEETPTVAPLRPPIDKSGWPLKQLSHQTSPLPSTAFCKESLKKKSKFEMTGMSYSL